MKNRAYSDWVRSLPCVVCDGPADQHHLIGKGSGIMGGKASDFDSFALCRRHHEELHRDVAKFERIHGGQLEHVNRTKNRAIFVGVLEVKK